MTINRYRYFYACAFSMFEKHLVAFVDEMVEHDHAESTVKIYLSCVNDVAKAMHAAGIAASEARVSWASILGSILLHLLRSPSGTNAKFRRAPPTSDD
jgi:hypothetical protein